MMDSAIQPTTLEQFRQIVYQAAKTRYRHISNASVEKELIDFEIEVFSSIPGYMDYLLILKGLVEAVKAHGIPVGPGYGASPASLVTYCFGITGIDPTDNDSIFELFADKGQKKFPVITLEFGNGGVAFAYKYLQDALGADRVARLMIAHDYLTNCHILFSLEDLQQIVPVHTEDSEGKAFSAVKKCDLKHNYKGQVFQVTVFVNWHLDEISKSLELINKRHQIEIRTEDIPLDDKETFALFSSGDTAGVPYYDIERMQVFLKEIGTVGFKDLMALSSLYVPDRMDQIRLLIMRKQFGFSSGRQRKLLDELLEDTYGIIVYREQLELFTFYSFGVSKKDIKSAHEAAAAITRERGYQWGETAKKEAVEKAHKPHEKVRMLVKPIVKEAVAEARSLEELKTVLASKGISCVFTVASDGRRGGISFAYEYEGQLHTFRGSSLDRQLSFGYIKAAIDKNSAREVQRQAAQQEQNKMKELRAAYSQMVPTIQGLHNAVNDTFQLYNDTKQAGIAIGTETSRKYGELRQSWKEFRQLNADRQKASDAGTVIKAIGGMLMFLNPIAGLVAMAIGKIATDIRISEIKSEKKSLLAKIEGLKSDIDALQQQKAQIKIEKQERLKDYLQAKDARNEFREGMEIIKSEIQQLKEQTKPKIAFDFKAAAQRISTPTTTVSHSSNVVKSESRFDLYSLVISAKNKDSLELALLERKAVMEPLKDSFGGVTDFRVTLAAEGRNTKASSLVSEEQLHQILDKWEALTGEKSVYRLEAERADWRKLEDICRKIDAVSPQNSPRTPKSISLLPGKEMEISYTTRNGNIQKLKVDASGILRVNGVILDVNTGKAVRIQEQNRTEKNRGIKMKR